MQCKINIRWMLWLVAAWCVLGNAPLRPAFAELAALTPVAQGQKIRDFSRLTFEWAQPVYLTVDSEGEQVTIRFERPAKPNMVSVSKDLSAVVRSHQLSPDGRTLTLQLKGKYRVRSFVSGNINGVDFMPVATTAPVKIDTTITTAASNSNAQKFAKIAPAIGKSMTPKSGAEIEEIKVNREVNETANKIADSITNSAKEAAPVEAEVVVEKEPETKPAAAKVEAPKPPPTPVKRVTDAEALAEAKKQRELAEKTTATSAEPIVDMSKMTDGEAIFHRNQEQKKADALKAAAAASTPPVTNDLKTQSDVVNPEDSTKKAAKQVAPTTSSKEPKNESVVDAAKTPAEKAPIKPELVAEDKLNQTAPVETNAAQAATESIANAKSEQAASQTSKEKETEVKNEGKQSKELELSSTDSIPTQAVSSENSVSTPDPSLSALHDTATENANGFRVRATLDNETLSLTFPWLERTAAAAFVRDGMAWLVFSTAAKLDLTEVNALLRAGTNINQMPVAGATVLFIPVSVGAGLKLENTSGTFKWIVKLTSNRQVSQQPLSVTLETEPPLKPHVFLPLIEAGKTVSITDPVIGDVMDVLPVFTQEVGISPKRSFVDFALLETSQGVVVQRFSDNTTITPVRNGVRISTENGAVLSPNLPLVEDIKKHTDNQENAVLFPYSNWTVAKGDDYLKEVKKLEKAISLEADGQDMSKHLRIAEIFLAQGSAVEALGYLNNIKRLNPDFFIDKRLSAMHGASNFLLQRYADAAQDFSVPELKDNKEVEFWQIMLSELLGNPNKKFSYEDNYETHIKLYPPIFRQRIGIIAADRAIASKEYNAALKIFDQLNEHKLISEVADYINYLMGKIALDTQQPEDGYKLWNALLDDKASEFVKVRAEFSLIIELMRRSTITEEEAVNRLERLAIRWRGDNLELAVLTALSEIYKSKKDWPNAIRIWRALNEAFPNTAVAVEAARSMDDAFIAMFDKGETGNLSTLESLFVFNEYRDLIPQDEVGDRIVDKLTDKMVDLDMLDQAQSMLEQRMRFRFEHQARSEVGAKLARIYLLDKKPEQALAALQLSGFGALSDGLIKTRTYLAAEALLELNRYEDLDTLLSEDESAEANIYRINAFWQQKDWENLAKIGEDALKKRKNATAELADYEADAVLKLALSYVATEESEQLAYLRDYFLPLMKDKPNEKVFEYLTRPYFKLTTENFESIVNSLESTQKFLTTLNQPTAAASAVQPVAIPKAPETAPAPAAPEQPASNGA